MTDRQLPRVRKLKLKGFKSFEQEVTLDFDNADIVLLAGANGAGKTSIVEALELAVTGEIHRRLGAEADSNKMLTFVYSDAGVAAQNRKATVEVTWSDTDVPTRIEIGAKGTLEGEACCAAFTVLQRGVLRAQTFLYADSLGSIIGMNEAARSQWLDAFLPKRARLEALDVAPVRSECDRLLRRAQAQLHAVHTGRERDIRAARTLADVAGQTGRSLALVTTQDKFNQKHTLRRWLEELNLPSEGPVEPEQLSADAIAGWADALEKRAADYDSAEVAAAAQISDAQAERTALRQTLEAPPLAAEHQVPPSATLRARQHTLRIPHDLDDEQAEADAQARTGSARQKSVWSTIGARAPNGRNEQVPVGTLPLLLSWRHLLRTDPAAAERLGLPTLTVTELTSLEQAEWSAWTEAGDALTASKTQLDAIQSERKAASTLREMLTAIEELETHWSAAYPDPLPTTDDGSLDLAAAREQVKQTSPPQPPPPNGPSAHDLRRLAEALRGWCRERASRDEAEAAAADVEPWQKAKELLEKAADLVNTIPNLEAAVRRHHIERHYQEHMNVALRRVLSGYAHRARVRDHLRVYFDRGNALRVAVGDHGKNELNRGLMSLSRSQYTSALLALALTTNLGRPDAPLGFVCLDDVSDALDLDNLAADAQLFRQLAYGPGRLRQLVLTNHNDEITDRLVPRLLPPAGRSMRVIEIKQGNRGEPAKIEHWEVKGESPGLGVTGRRSPLMDILGHRRASGATGER